MPRRGVDITGMRFGRLVAIKSVGTNAVGKLMWECQCDCGNSSIVAGKRLRNGHNTSCGYCSRHKDITGQKFGRLTALQPVGININGAMQWLCLCDCGQKHIAHGGGLRYGNIRSCGCRAGPYRHGHTKKGKQHPLYTTWNGMRERCNNPNNKDYKHYGARGIKVDPHWDDFVNFLADIIAIIGKRPPGFVLDRIDNDGPYAPYNIRWATLSTSNKNKRYPKHHTRPEA
jgi:hypothetical protein